MLEKPRVLIFDLDRTITRLPTYTPFLLRSALKLAPWRLVLIIFLIPFFGAYAVGLVDRKGLKQIMHRMFLGANLKKHRVEMIANRFADHIIPAGVFDQARDLISCAQTRGDRVILATASHRFYVTAIANRLNIGEIVATKSVWRNDALTWKIDGENCYGDGKVRMVRDHLANAGVDPVMHHIVFYSDHISDLPLFELSDEPVATNPSATLRDLARHRGWQILEWS